MSQGTADWQYVEKMRALKRLCGGKCRQCGSTRLLEFAHLKPTGLSGRGRGARRRYLDVVRNPDCYELLCRRCHRRKDYLASFEHRATGGAA